MSQNCEPFEGWLVDTVKLAEGSHTVGVSWGQIAYDPRSDCGELLFTEQPSHAPHAPLRAITIREAEPAADMRAGLEKANLEGFDAIWLVDFDGDGTEEGIFQGDRAVGVVEAGGRVRFAIDARNAPEPSEAEPWAGPPSIDGLSLTDIERDGKLELVVTTSGYEYQGSTIYRYPTLSAAGQAGCGH